MRPFKEFGVVSSRREEEAGGRVAKPLDPWANLSSVLARSTMAEIPAEVKEQIFNALGKAVVRIWSGLSQDVQQHLFEEAVKSQGEPKRQGLAIFLHDEHQRTADTLKSRAILSPDSLGG
jgi:hypothetical protein